MVAAALSAMGAVAFAVIVYFAGTSIAWFASSPTSDPLFGRHNHCLLTALHDARTGFAVSPDGEFTAGFDGKQVAVCRLPPSAAADAPAQLRRWPLRGVTHAAWDWSGTLWVAARSEENGVSTLWRMRSDAEPQRAGEISAVALAGHGRGLVALGADGKLISLGSDGAALGFVELPHAAGRSAQLSVDASGKVVSVVASGGVWVFSADALEPLRAESPCDVEYLWWSTEPARAIVSCGPGESWALTLDAISGTREELPKRSRIRAALVQKLKTYVRACDGLPCQSEAP